MNPFDVYCCYLALKNHFTKESYDYFKYHGKVRTTIQSFNKRKDKYFFEKTSRQKTDQEILEYFVSNFIQCDDPQRLWIGEIIQTGENNYTNWKKRTQSLRYSFTENIEVLLEENSIDDIFDCSKGHPILLKLFLSNKISIETMVILDKTLSYVKRFDKVLLDPVWETVSLRIKKYKPFLNIDVDSYKEILKKRVLNE
jgi:hypothetical protein